MSTNASRDNSPFSKSASASDHVRRQSPAFRGASHAFSHLPPTIKPLHNTYSGTNGALAAASTAGLGTRREERLYDGVTTAFTSSSVVNNSRRSASLDVREPMSKTPQSREQSPSHTAALLAASRATPTREPKPSIRPNPRRPSPLRSITSDGTVSLNHVEPRDETSAGDTVSLVKLFESKTKPHRSAPVTHSVRYVNKPPPAIATPTPIRPLRRSTSSTAVSLRTLPRQSGEGRAPMTSVTTSHLGAAAAAADLVGRPRAVTDRSAKLIVASHPEPPAPRRTRIRPSLDGSEDSGEHVAMVRPRSQAHQTLNTDTSEAFLNDAATELRRTNPIAIPLRKPSSRPALVSYRTSDEHILYPARSGRKSTRSSDTYVPQLTVDSLANAMVASSLASSRAPSPTKPPPLPAPRRHGKHSLFHHHHSQEQMSRTPSPAKGMRQTMREPPKSDDEADFRKKRSQYIKKHHKHHEGDRKRYRNQVTERERKRYEGVWAANKGLFMDTDSSNAVINVVVRDIWKRSRLPDDVLEEVWDLVGTQGSDRLGREEFVVGMFLIDQRLKGNKLPFKVSDSIWSSVRRLTGIDIPNHRR